MSARIASHRQLRHKTKRLDDTLGAVSEALEVCPSWWIRYTYRAFTHLLSARPGAGWEAARFFTVASKVI